jgi:hypothetical protein
MATRADDGGGWDRALRIAPWGVAAVILLLPLVAMQLTDEVDWDVADFVIIGALLFAACGAFELAARRTGDIAYRAGVGVAVVAAFLLIWVNLAVGIIGEENQPANLLYLGVIGVGLLGALAARFRPEGMARAFVATALAQALVLGAILIGGWGLKPAVLTAFFVMPWLASAWLFRKAAQGSAGAPR